MLQCRIQCLPETKMLVTNGSLMVDFRARGHLWGELGQEIIPQVFTHSATWKFSGRAGMKERMAGLYLCLRGENLDSFRSADYMGMQGEGGTLVFMAASEIDRIMLFPSTLEKSNPIYFYMAQWTWHINQ